MAIDDRQIALPSIVAGPTALLCLAENLYHDLQTDRWIRSPLYNYLFPVVAPFVAMVLCSLLGWFALSYGRTGFLSLLVGHALALFALLHFRGPVHWDGLFDLEGRPIWRVYLWQPASLLLALGLSRCSQLRQKVSASRCLVVAVLLSVPYTSAQPILVEDIHSYFPFTRQLALAVIVAGVFGASFVATKVDPTLWEDE